MHFPSLISATTIASLAMGCAGYEQRWRRGGRDEGRMQGGRMQGGRDSGMQSGQGGMQGMSGGSGTQGGSIMGGSSGKQDGNKLCFKTEFNVENTVWAIKNSGQSGEPPLNATQMAVGRNNFYGARGNGHAYVSWDPSNNEYDIVNQIDYLDGPTEGMAMQGSKMMNKFKIGYHLHVGDRSAANGAVVVVYCMQAPLPALGPNPQCPGPMQWYSHFSSEYQESTCKMKGECAAGQYMQPVADKTNPFAKMKDGTDMYAERWQDLKSGKAPKSQEVFHQALQQCHKGNGDECYVYFNFHTKYSFTMTNGLGLGRGQVRPVGCQEMEDMRGMGGKQQGGMQQGGGGGMQQGGGGGMDGRRGGMNRRRGGMGGRRSEN